MTDIVELLNAKNKLEQLLMSNTGSYTGIGISIADDAVTVYLRDNTEQAKKKAFELLGSNKADGHEILFRNSGHLVALQCNPIRTTYSRPCLTGDTIILGEVPKRIIDIKVGDIIYSFNNNYQIEKRKVAKTIYSGTKQIYSLKTYGYSIKTTEDHPFLKFIGTDYIRIRDTKGRYNGIKSDKIFSWVELKSLREGDLIGVYKSIPQETLESLYSFEFCKTIGLFIGDGCLIRSHNRIGGIQWAIPEGDKSRDKYKEIIKKEFGKCNDKRYLRLYSKDTAILFQKLGLDYKCEEKHIPDWIFRLPYKHKIAIIEGMIDSDGTTRKREKGKRNISYSYASVSKRLIEDLCTLIQSMGYSVSSIMKTPPKIMKICKNKNLSVSMNSYRVEWVKEKKKPVNFKGINFSNFPITLTRIKSIEKLDAQKVYDLEIEENHNFIANGLIVHNCCGGYSIGNSLVGAGTMASVVYDKDTKEKRILSNSHVLSNASSYQNPTANIGDIIYAPGCLDTSGCINRIGTLSKFIPLDENATNFVDCALATPDNPNDVSNEIVGIGTLTGYEEPLEKMHVWKSGRTSGLTEGDITDFNATMEVDYGGRIIRFANCIVTPAIGLSGDSGSMLVEKSNNKAVGILFAGSDTITIFNRISYVMNSLGILTTTSDIPPNPIYTTPSGNIYDQAGALGIAAIGLGAVAAIVPAINQQFQLWVSRKF